MTSIYVLHNNGSSKEMVKTHCKNEDLELQRILECNPNLIPGDQIRPEDPRRWLLVRREMPVADPNTTGDDQRWSLDFLFVDQDATPTLVECKRYNSTGARREVVGQLLEYAANAHYWTKEVMQAYAEESAEKGDTSLEEQIRTLNPEGSEAVGEFFQRVQDNLREGQIRLVFFLEESPLELKNIVHFLNKQMERSEVFLVEAHQYEHGGTKIIAPRLFGYTEEARQVKKRVSVNTGKKKFKWNQELFFKKAEGSLSEKEVSAIQSLHDATQKLKCNISWGKGKKGAFHAKWQHLGTYPVYNVELADGIAKIRINYSGFQSPEQKGFATFLKKELHKNVGFQAPSKGNKDPSYKISEWAEKVSELVAVFESIDKKFPCP